MKTLLRPALVLLILSIATPTALPQSGGGANIGGAANTAEGTGRGAGGPGDGEGPGQGAGQGLGPGGRDKTDREKSKKEKAEKEKQDRQRREKEKRERTEKEKQERERSDREKDDQEKQKREQREKEDREKQQREKEDREKFDKERQNREREEEETRQRDEKEKEQKERERTEKEKQEREKTERERVEKEDEERKNNEREKPEKENPPREDPEKDREERDRPGADQPESRGDETVPREDKPADGKPSEPVPPTSPEDKEKGNPQPTDPKAEEATPPAPQPGPRDLPAAPTDPKPALDRSSVDPLIPGSDNIPGARQLGENVQSLTDPSSAVDRFFGFFTGGKRRAVAEPAVVVSRSGKNVVTVERPAGARRSRGAFLGIFRPEFPNLVQATRVRDVAVDSRVTSPRTVTYKSRLSRVSRWIGPLTLGLLNYVPFETMNAAVAGRINNLMAEEEISVEQLVARTFEDGIRKKNRYVIAKNPEAVFELEMTRYALDPMPTSLGRMKPTVSVTGRLYNTRGQLLWIGKGFSTIVEKGLKGATVEQYEDNPAQLRTDFETAARIAMSRLVAQANAVPRASVKVTAAE